MKYWKWMQATALCAVGALAFTACDNDDDDDGYTRVPAAVEAAFADRYGGHGRVDWDAERGGYCVAEFYMDGRECEAWYSPDGSWMMTEVDYGRNLQALPQAVQDGYNATTYAQDGWRIDDIDEIQRPGYENVYKIEVEKDGQPDRDLYFDLGGTLFRDVQDDGRDHDNSGMIHDRLPAALSDYINTQYPGAAIVDFDREDGGYYEVDLRHEGKSIEVAFDREGNWVMSKTDCDRTRASGRAHRRLRLYRDARGQLLARGDRAARARPARNGRRAGGLPAVKAKGLMDGQNGGGTGSGAFRRLAFVAPRAQNSAAGLRMSDFIHTFALH